MWEWGSFLPLETENLESIEKDGNRKYEKVLRSENGSGEIKLLVAEGLPGAAFLEFLARKDTRACLLVLAKTWAASPPCLR